jgi:hypothetical protein
MVVDLLALPLTHVVYHHPINGFKIVAKGFKGANGIIAQRPGKKLFISNLVGGVSFLMSCFNS